MSQSVKTLVIPGIRDKEFITLLRDELEKRKKSNIRYSIRAYANFLGIDQSLLSKVLKCEKLLSEASKFQCLKRLNIPDSVINNFIDATQMRLEFEWIQDGQFETLSDWRHFAILELATLKGISINEKVIHERLGISESAARIYLDRLISFGFFEVKSDGELSLSRPNNTWYHPSQTSLAKKMLQQSLLEESIKCLNSVPYELRDHSSTTIAIKTSRIPAIKEIIQDARKKLSHLIQEEGDFDEVYQLTISFFPLTQTLKGNPIENNS